MECNIECVSWAIYWHDCKLTLINLMCHVIVYTNPLPLFPVVRHKEVGCYHQKYKMMHRKCHVTDISR